MSRIKIHCVAVKPCKTAHAALHKAEPRRSLIVRQKDWTRPSTDPDCSKADRSRLMKMSSVRNCEDAENNHNLEDVDELIIAEILGKT
jgi:hypothetical protein